MEMTSTGLIIDDTIRLHLMSVITIIIIIHIIITRNLSINMYFLVKHLHLNPVVLVQVYCWPYLNNGTVCSGP